MLSGEEIRTVIVCVGWKNLMDGRDRKSNHAIEILMASKSQHANFSCIKVCLNRDQKTNGKRKENEGKRPKGVKSNLEFAKEISELAAPLIGGDFFALCLIFPISFKREIQFTPNGE